MLNLNPGGIVMVGIIILTLLWLVWRPSLKRFFHSRNKPLAIRNQARYLGRKLHIRYGLHDYYTPAQVQQAIRESGFSTAYYCYGLAMYCNESDFMDYHQSIGESCNYPEMCNEISTYLALPDSTFTASNIIDWGASFNSSFSGDFFGNEHQGSSDAGGGGYDGAGSSDAGGGGGYDGGGSSGGY